MPGIERMTLHAKARALPTELPEAVLQHKSTIIELCSQLKLTYISISCSLNLHPQGWESGDDGLCQPKLFSTWWITRGIEKSKSHRH